jgi:hypothetical protein
LIAGDIHMMCVYLGKQPVDAAAVVTPTHGIMLQSIGKADGVGHFSPPQLFLGLHNKKIKELWHCLS